LFEAHQLSNTPTHSVTRPILGNKIPFEYTLGDIATFPA